MTAGAFGSVESSSMTTARTSSPTMRRLTTRYVSRTRRFSEAVDSGLNRTRLDSDHCRSCGG